MGRTVVMAAASLVVGVLMSACSHQAQPATPRSMPSPSAAPTDPETVTREAVLAGYTGMWTDYQQDLSTANWQNPVVVHHATGEALLDLENMLAVDGHHGWIGKGAPVLRPKVRTLPTAGSPTTAEVVDCADLSRALTYVAATGALKDSTPGGRHLIDATLVLKGGAWKVSSLATGEVGSC